MHDKRLHLGPGEAGAGALSYDAGATGAVEARLRSLDYLFALGLTVCLAAITWQRVVPDVVGIYNDDGVYVVTAKALATGQGYRLLHLPGEPVQTKYPPLFPTVLAAVWWLCPRFPDNVLVVKAVCVAFSSVAGGLTWLFLVRFGYASRIASALGLGVGFCTPRMLYLFSTPLSESLFLALLVPSAWVAEHIADANRPVRWPVATAGGLLLAALALTRSAGLFIAAGVILSLLLRRRLRVAYVVWAAVPVLAWHGWVAITASAPGHLQDAYNVNYVDWWRQLAFQAPGHVVLLNLAAFVFDIGIVESDGVTNQGAIIAQAVPYVVLLSLSTWGAAIAAVRGRFSRPLVLGLVAYLMAVAVWPWAPRRFLLVTLPIVFSLAIESALRVPGTKGARRAVAALAIGVAIVVLLTGMASSLRVGQAARSTGYPVRAVFDPQVSWEGFEQAFAAVGRLTPQDAVVATVVDPMVYLYAGRKGAFAYEMNSIAFHYLGDGGWMTPERLARYWRERRVTHVLRLPIATWAYPAFEDAMARLRRERPKEYVTIWSSVDRRFELIALRIPQPQGPSRPED